MNTYYIALARELSGYCLRAEAESKEILEFYLEKYYGRIWHKVLAGPPPFHKSIGCTIKIGKSLAQALIEDAEKLPNSF